MIIKRSIFIVIFGLCGYLLSAQTITGIVTDKSETPLVGATVILLAKVDSTFISAGQTNSKGQISVENETEDKQLILQVSYIGYQEYTHELEIKSNDEIDLGTIALSEDIQELNGVVIEGERIPFKVNKDTIIYNADAFKLKSNDAVEDLLRKLPGIEVNSDGTVIAQGEEVKTILIDGKVFFGNDTEIATKNLSAAAIDKLELYDKQSDKAEFIGVDDGNQAKTINLVLKESYRKGMFGVTSLGYGTEKRYDGGFNINRYNSKTQTSLFGGINNINKQGFPGSSFDSGKTSSLGSQGLSSGFVRSVSGGLNLNHDFSKKLQLRTSYITSILNNRNDAQTIVDNYTGDISNFISRDTSSQESTNKNHRINITAMIEPDSSQELGLTTSLNYSDSESTNFNNSGIFSENLLQSVTNARYESIRDNMYLNGSMSYRKKFGKVNKHIFSMEFSYNNSLIELENLPESTVRYFSQGVSNLSIKQQQIEHSNEDNYRLELAYIKPLKNKQVLEFNFNRDNYDTELIQDVYDLLLSDSAIVDSLSAVYNRDYVYDRYAVTYYNSWPNTDLTISGGVQRSAFDGFTQVDSLQRNNLNILPRISLRQTWKNGSRSRLNYTTRVREPSVAQLQPIIDNSNPQNIFVGNLDLVNEYQHSLNLNFINFDQTSFTSWFVFFTAAYTQNKIVNQSFFDNQFRQITTPINVRNEWSLITNISYSRPIKKLGVKLNANATANYRRSIAFVNNAQTNVKIVNPSLKLVIENRDKEYFDLSVGASYGYSHTVYDQLSDRNRNFVNSNYYMDFSWTPIDYWEFGTSMNIDFYDQAGIADPQVVPIWNVNINRSFGSKEAVGLELQLFDILNRNNGISQTAGLNNFTYSESNSLGLYIMCKLIYRMRS